MIEIYHMPVKLNTEILVFLQVPVVSNHNIFMTIKMVY